MMYKKTKEIKKYFEKVLQWEIEVKKLDDKDEVVAQMRGNYEKQKKRLKELGYDFNEDNEVTLDDFGGYALYTKKKPNEALVKINPNFNRTEIFSNVPQSVLSEHVVLHEFMHLIDFKLGITEHFEASIIKFYSEYFADKCAWIIQGYNNPTEMAFTYLSAIFNVKENPNDIVIKTIDKKINLLENNFFNSIKKIINV